MWKLGKCDETSGEDEGDLEKPGIDKLSRPWKHVE